MTKIEVRYVKHSNDIIYNVKDPVVADEMYYVQGTYMEFKAVLAHTSNLATIIVPFDNVLSIRIWKESDEVDESKNS